VAILNLSFFETKARNIGETKEMLLENADRDGTMRKNKRGI
jgi:endonuclease III